MNAAITTLLGITIFFFIVFLLSWINERKIFSIILGIITLISCAAVGCLAWKYDQVEKFQIVHVEKIEKYNEPAYEFTLRSNQGNMDKVWIREKDLNTYNDNSMFIEAVNEYKEDKN